MSSLTGEDIDGMSAASIRPEVWRDLRLAVYDLAQRDAVRGDLRTGQLRPYEVIALAADIVEARADQAWRGGRVLVDERLLLLRELTRFDESDRERAMRREGRRATEETEDRMRRHFLRNVDRLAPWGQRGQR